MSGVARGFGVALTALALAGCSSPPQQSAPPPSTATQAGDAATARFRCVGNEPGWSLEIGPDSIAFVGDYGEVRATYPVVVPRTADGLWDYETEITTAEGRSWLAVTIVRDTCSDGMSDRVYDHRARVMWNYKAYLGCATRL